MTDLDYAARINRHYGAPNLGEAILEGLRRAGKDPAQFGYEDLVAFDHFHTRGKPATAELAELAGIKPGEAVLDIGGGLGGPARSLAAEFGATVTVLDITEAYCRVGEMLTARTGLSERVTFRTGNALDLPFERESFDVVWTQHSSMNIEDKERLYREVRRVLRPRGRLALHEIVAGPRQPIHFPVPWALAPETSFLRPAAEVRSLVQESGFEEAAFRDTSKAAFEWGRERLASAPATPPPLGLHLLLGRNFKPAFQNMLRNLEQDRIAIIEAVYRAK